MMVPDQGGEEAEAGQGRAFVLDRSMKPSITSAVMSPSEEGMHSPLCFGSEALSFRGDAAAAAYSVHTELAGALQAGRCGRKGVPILHQKGVSFTKRRRCPHSPGVEAVGSAHSSSLSCSLSGVNGAQGSPKRRADWKAHTAPALIQVVFLAPENPKRDAAGCAGRPPSPGSHQCG